MSDRFQRLSQETETESQPVDGLNASPEVKEDDSGQSSSTARRMNDKPTESRFFMGTEDLRKVQFPFAIVKFPILEWSKTYTKDDFYGDLNSGLVICVLLVPQGLAYAVLAGMPPVYGLYSAIIPLLVYSCLGTVKQISMGPMAITSLLVGTGIKEYDPDLLEESSEWISVSLALAFWVGLICCFMGFLKLGVLSNFLSFSVMTGFVTASALLIALSQLKNVFGIKIPRDLTYTHEKIGHLVSHLDETNLYSLLLGQTSWIGLYLTRNWLRVNKARASKPDASTEIKILVFAARIANLIAVVVASCCAIAITESGKYIPIVGKVPEGLIAPTLPDLSMDTFVGLFPTAVTIAIIAFMGNWGIAKKFSDVYQYEVSATQELYALGFANLVGAFFNSFVVSAGLSRSAANAESGARTPVSGVISSLCVVISLLVLTKLFYYIPMALLGSIIEVSVMSMMDFDQFSKAYKTNMQDFVVMSVTFLLTFFLGIMEGILVGVVLSVIFVINSSAFPHIAHLGGLTAESLVESLDEKVQEKNRAGMLEVYYRDIKRFPCAEQKPGIAIVRMDASLYFANAAYFKDRVLRASRGEFHTSDVKIDLVILDCSCWQDCDLSGANVLTDLYGNLLRNKTQLGFANAKWRVRERLMKTTFVDKLGVDVFFYSSITDAVQSMMKRTMSIDRDIAAVLYDNECVPEMERISLANCAQHESLSDIGLGLEKL